MKCLVIAYAFPPIANAEAFVGAKTIIGLAKMGVKVTVITINPFKSGLNIDNAFNQQISEYVDKIVHIELSDLEYKLLKVFPLLTNIALQYPDKFVLYNKYTLNRIKKINLDNYDVLITRSQWHSAHLVGLTIKEKYPNIPWIAQFSDPWVDNPYNLKMPFSHYLASKWERKIIELADIITYTSKETVNLVMQKYDSKYISKAYYLPHCFDLELYKQKIKTNKTKYVIRCLGAFYGKRSPEPFFKAIEYIANYKKELLEDVLIEFYGIDDKRKRLIEKYPLAQKFIKLFKGVNYSESLNKMQSADCLVSIDAPLNFSPFFPSKLVDYMGSNSCIFSISPNGSANNIIDYVGGVTADISNLDDIIKKMIYILEVRPNALENKKYLEFEQSKVSGNFYKLLERSIK